MKSSVWWTIFLAPVIVESMKKYLNMTKPPYSYNKVWKKGMKSKELKQPSFTGFLILLKQTWALKL